MSSSVKEQSPQPGFSPKKARDLLNFPNVGREGFEKMDNDSKMAWLLHHIEQIMRGEGLIGGVDSHTLTDISDVVGEMILAKKQLSKEAKYLIEFLFAVSLNTSLRALNKNAECLLGILKQFKSDDDNFRWFYEKITSYLSESQLLKLQEAYTDSHSRKPELSFSDRKKVITGIIYVFNQETHRVIINTTDSPSFLGLDNSAREAVCWKELELSRSENADFSRLAGIIAWKNWLFKEPLLKEFCLKKNLDFKKLSSSEKIDLTKQAVDFFSVKERARIIDQAVEEELSSRKESLIVEKDKKFINKRVSMGSELEMDGLSFEMAIIYAWYENLDRSLEGDSLAYSDEIEKLFEQLVQFKDQKIVINNFEANNLEIAQIVENFKSDLTEEEQVELKKQVDSIVAALPDESIREQFEVLLKDSSPNLPILELLQKVWKNKLNAANSSFLESKEVFRSSLTKMQRESTKYRIQSGFARSMPVDYPDIAHKLLDIFKHHMVQIQAIGHALGADAFGEYSLAYTSGNFKDPYRVNLRETWELAKTAFHNLNVKARPMHTTIGWKEDKEKRKITITAKAAYEQASVLNFALMATGWTNRSFIVEFRELNELLLLNEKRTARVNSNSDSGKGKSIIIRSESGAYGAEFRGFSPAPGIDMLRLFSSLGSLGTAMKAYLVVESDTPVSKIDTVDRKLHAIWQKFSDDVGVIYTSSGDFPDLFDANNWQSENYSETVTNFYLKMAEDLDKDTGMVADMRKLIQETITEIDEVFKTKDKSKSGLDFLSKIGFARKK